MYSNQKGRPSGMLNLWEKKNKKKTTDSYIINS